MVETFARVGPTLVLSGVAVTLVPVLVTFLIGHKLFRMNLAILFGAITGAMTSTGALQQIGKQAQSTLPTLGYVGSYAFANVLLAIAGAILVRL